MVESDKKPFGVPLWAVSAAIPLAMLAGYIFGPPAMAIYLSALCIWLTVRIVNRREQWAKRTLAVVVGLPVLYFLSFGPLMWLEAQGYMYSSFGDHLRAYAAPVRMIYDHSPQPIKNVLAWYERVSRGIGR
jgi:hypothetical protein